MANGWEDLPSSGGGSGSNASVGTNGSAAPSSSTEVGFINAGGNLTAVSPTNPLPVDIHLDTVNVSENLAQVNGATVNVGVGASSTGTQRVAVSSDSSLTANQATAANLNATVVGTGTFATQAAQSGTWNVTNVSGTVSLPTGASTSALQTTGNTALSAIQTSVANMDLGIPTALGQTTMSASMPIVVASDQSAIPVSSTTLATSANLTAGTQKTQLVDSAGNIASTMTLATGALAGAGTSALAVAQSGTNFVNSSVNSSSVQLAASATFTGTVENAYAQQSFSILMTSDQPMTLTVYQYIDSGGTQLAQSNVFLVAAGAGFAISFPINGNYVKVSAQNTGASTTTTFNLSTTYGTIPSANHLGNTPVSIGDINGTAISGSTLPVNISSQTLPSAPLTGQKTSTGTAIAISSTSQPLTQGVIVQALSTNAGIVYVGGSGVTTATGFQLQPGQATSTAVNNLNAVYVIAVISGDGVCYVGS